LSEDSGELSEAEEKKVDESNIKITFQNVVPITLTRNFLSRYCYYPQFESVIIGCFIRVKVDNRGNDYRFARIEGLSTVPKYDVEGVPVDQGLALSQGSAKQVINMDFASNSPVTEVFHF
jgi:RNA polymerase-associated protein RTF1